VGRRVLMLETAADESGCYQGGKQYELSKEKAKAYVDAKAARYVGSAPMTPRQAAEQRPDPAVVAAARRPGNKPAETATPPASQRETR
jgi:hypothetical protein